MQKAMRQKRILLIEDNDQLVGAIIPALEKHGYFVHRAGNGPDALDQMRAMKPDLVLLNIATHASTDWQFRNEQKRDPELAYTPVLTFAGSNEWLNTTDGVRAAEKNLLENIDLTLRAGVIDSGRFEISAEDRFTGQTLPGGWRLLRKIGGGGMSVVYEADHADRKEHVAVKILSGPLASRPDATQRFTNEARAVALLNHPNIVNAHEIGSTENGMPFLVLELLTGQTLEAEIRSSGPMVISRAIRITRDIAAALTVVHKEEIVHRDVKPGNVFLTHQSGNEVAKVFDFGISKFLGPWSGSRTQTGELLGTPNYMAPEQLSDARTVSPQTDVYGLGATLYEMLAGKPPFSGENFPILLLQILTDPPPPLSDFRSDIPVGLLDVIDRALHKSMDARWKSIGEFADALAPYEGLDRVPKVKARTAKKPSFSVTSWVQSAARPLIMPEGPSVLFMILCLIAITLGTFAIYSRSSLHFLHTTDSHNDTAITLAVDCNRPNCYAKIRGVSHSLPLHEKFKTSAKREPVEITAPGYLGRRFWLIFNRSHQLSVEIVEGKGIEDATEAEIRRELKDAVKPPQESTNP